MQPARLALVFLVANVATSSAPLRVLRVSPDSPADPMASVTVTFDRPVAGGLESMVDPASVVSIEPAVAGRAEWRDPVTLRFTPASPLEPGREYTVRVEAGLRALDGSRLERAHVFRFRVSPPRVLAGDPIGPNGTTVHLAPSPVLRLLFSAAPDRSALERAASIAFDAACGGQTVALRVGNVRRIADDDPPYFRYLGWDRPWSERPDTLRDLRRVVELTPSSPLPRDCGGTLRLPDVVGSGATMQSWAFRTYGPLRLAEVGCARGDWCPTGPIRARFTTPVHGGELVRRLRVDPGVAFTVADTSDISAEWILHAQLTPRSPYAVTADSALTDVFGQQLTGVAVRAFRTTGYAPSITYDYGRMLVEREGFRTLAVQHVTVDSLSISAVPVPDSMEAAFLSRPWNWDEPLATLAASAQRFSMPAPAGRDERMVTGVRLPARGEPLTGRRESANATLWAVRVSSPALDSLSRRSRPVALVQVTDLGVHARVGADEGMVWVTGVNDGEPRPGAHVTLYDAQGRVRATAVTDDRGVARLASFRSYAGTDGCEGWCGGFEGYVAATHGDDRAVVALSSYDPDLAPWRFGISGAWGQEREPQAAAVFTERGIYRPGETVHAKAIVRNGTLGDLAAPARGDSVRWLFRDREGGELRDTVVALSAFGTSDAALTVGAELPLGDYSLELERRFEGEWRTVAWTSYQVAEYRPPEFLVDVTGDARPRFASDTLTAVVAGRYLFGAPMGAAPVRWTLRTRPLSSWELSVPGADGYQLGEVVRWWDESGEEGVRVVAEGVDTLDITGQADVRVAAPEPAAGRAANVSVIATVTDANRQTVTGGASWTVHPAAFYIGARVRGERWFWTTGTPVDVELIAVTPGGERVAGVAIDGVVVRREWHRVRRVRGGQIDEIGGWVSDTVATCAARTTADAPAGCRFTPDAGGEYTVRFTARDDAGRTAVTSIARWASGPDWVPWNDDSQLRMDLIADRDRYQVGDTATVMLAAPFTDAEAWVTVERERVLESRRMRIAAGATTIRLPITEAYAPSAYVSVVLVRGRSAPPGPLDDPGRPTIRVGYAELRVTPEVKRLAVDVQPLAPDGVVAANGSGDPVEYRPGDTARVALAVHDAEGRPQRAEVTLWAVDEGVLALTGYRTPDPIDLLYRARGLGVRLASNLVSVAPQVPDGQKGRREPGGGGGGDLAGILRSRFQTTAFFLGSVVTDESGRAVASAKLPDNLTTFRVMAVAVTAGDRYGSGEAKLLVTRPLVARPSLPRFVREGDRFAAGVIVNHRLGGTPRVEAEARVTGGAKLEGGRRKNERLAAGRGAELRFDFSVPRTGRARTGPATDSASITLSARAEDEADAVVVTIPVRPDHHPLASTVAGVLRDTATAELVLEGDVDASRSRLEIGIGASPLTVVQGAGRDLRVYPYFCTEQVASTALPLIALYRARLALGDDVGATELAADIRIAVRTLTRRQTADGGIGYWSALDWSTPWLSAYAGRVLLEARAAGIAVDSAVFANLAEYVRRELHETDPPRAAVAWAYTDDAVRASERVAAADFLSRVGRADVPVENTLLQQAARLRWEDRVLLAEMLARRGAMQPARQLLDAAWNDVGIEGRRAVLPANARGGHYFESTVRPAARLLEATLAIEPAHAGIGPLVETLVQRGRGGVFAWNTQDYGWAVLALTAFEERNAGAVRSELRVRSGRRTLFAGTVDAVRDTAFSLDGLVTKDDDGRPIVRLAFDAPNGSGAPVWFHATVREIPKNPPVSPVDRGIQVERWYERPGARQPILTAVEGDVVRVRLRITVPTERHFVVLDDPLPAGLEAVDLSLRTVSPFGAEADAEAYQEGPIAWEDGWYYGAWDSGMWSPFDHRELRDDRVIHSATILWPGTYTATYLARATTAGTFVLPPAHAEEMYNPGVNGRSGGASFTVTRAR